MNNKIVHIIEISISEIVARYPVDLSGLNYVPNSQEYYDEAWQSAIEDELVVDGARQSYEFKLIDNS